MVREYDTCIIHMFEMAAKMDPGLGR